MGHQPKQSGVGIHSTPVYRNNVQSDTTPWLPYMDNVAEWLPDRSSKTKSQDCVDDDIVCGYQGCPHGPRTCGPFFWSLRLGDEMANIALNINAMMMQLKDEPAIQLVGRALLRIKHRHRPISELDKMACSNKSCSFCLRRAARVLPSPPLFPGPQITRTRRGGGNTRYTVCATLKPANSIS